MRICHLTTVHTPKDIRIFIKECQSLSNYYDTHYIVPNADNIEVDSKVTFHNIKKDSDNRFIRMSKLNYRLYKKAKSLNCDIYHFHDPELIPVGLILKARGKQVIYDVHEDFSETFSTKSWIPKPLRKFVSTSFKVFEGYAARKFDGIVAATPYIAQKFMDKNNNTVNVNNYPIVNELAFEGENWESRKKAVSYVGGITESRGIFKMVEAMEGTQYILELAGRFMHNSQREEVMTFKGWSQVNELGQINRKEVKFLLSQSMAGLVLFQAHPNHINAQPNKLFEYMSAGIPVICSNFPLWREIIEKNNCGICVDPTDAKEIRNAINWFLENPMEAKEMGENGVRAIKEKYNWSEESNKLIGLYKKIESQ